MYPPSTLWFYSVKIRELTTSAQGVSPASVKRGQIHVLACLALPLAALLSANWGKGARCCAGPVAGRPVSGMFASFVDRFWPHFRAVPFVAFRSLLVRFFPSPRRPCFAGGVFRSALLSFRDAFGMVDMS